MMKSLLASAAFCLVAIPLAAQAQDEETGRYEVWMAEIGEASEWAVIDNETDAAVHASKSQDGVAIESGDAAQEALAALRESFPGLQEIEIGALTLGEGTNIRISDDDGSTQIMKIGRDGDMRGMDIDHVLEDVGIEIDGERRQIVIRTERDDSAVNEAQSDAAAEADDEKIKDTVTKRVQVVTMPTPPTPPKITAIETNGDTVVINTQSKTNWNYEIKEDGVERSYVHMDGLSAEEAVEFIDDVDDLSTAERAEMKAVLSL